MRHCWIVAALAVLAGCRAYDPSLVPRDGGLDAPSSHDAALDAPLEDAGATDASTPDGGADAGPRCDPKRPPAMPPLAAGDRELVFALRDVVVDQRSGRWESLGYDLDGLCTSVADPTGACAPPSGDAPAVDGSRGVDNVFGKELLALAITYIPTIERDARDDMERGRASMVVQVRGWSGEDDDGRVDAVLAQTTRAQGAGAEPPRWDGADRWWLAESDFLDGDPARPLVRDDVAYVVGRTLVMRIPDGRAIVFPWSGNVLRLQLTSGLLTGRISEDGARLEDVVVAGRWSLIEIDGALTAAGLCRGELARTFIDSALRRSADVRSDARTDGSGAACDAVSVAVGFTGYAATIGGIEAVPAGTAPCGT